MRRYFLAAAFLAASLAPAAATADVRDQARALVELRLGGLTSSPLVLEMIARQNARTGALGQDEIDALDARWRGGDDDLIGATLANPLSRRLAEIVAEADGAFSEIFVMDARGLNVGQSAKTSDYWQGDEAKWLDTFLAGPGAVHVSEVEEDESTQTFQVQVSLAVADGGAAIGAITIGVDVAHLE